ncbi:hypothetical protein SteCoe_5531 [Stentor coeruleus]|uniref:Uncharacterized protein n=1 Tax=Stentor coeruleus TaxID=5963 RepID=A0A1R2CS98_9CILI|nr:hypothetical protein SteCoe_5531 [Stentor coeruleus]
MKSLSKKTVPTKESTEISRLLLEVSSEYTGLSCAPKNSPYFNFYIDPLYKFPSLLNFPLPNLLSDSECFLPDTVKVSAFYESLEANSPFKKGSQVDVKDSLLQGETHCVPQNSANTSSLDLFNDKYVSIESLHFNSFSSINTSQAKDSMISTMNFCEKLLGKDENIMHQGEPGNCYKQIQNNHDREQEKINRKMNFSNLELSIDEASKRLYQKADDTEILSNDEAMITGMKSDESWKKNPCLVELIPEGENENSWLMYRSIEALQKASLTYIDIEEDNLSSPDDEGPLRVEAGRMFLNGGTASKSKLSEVINTHQVIKNMSRKNAISPSDLMLSTIASTKVFTSIPDPLCPLLKKLVIIEQTHNKGSIIYSVSTCGFGSSLSIEFSEAEGKSRVFTIQKEKSLDLWYGLMASTSLNVLLQLSIKWLSCGFEHMAAVTKEGKVLTWGNGSSGCLGHGNKESLYVPSIIESLYQQKIVYIESGGYHNVALSEKGEVWVWGRGDVNQLGVDFSYLQKDQIGFVALNPVKIHDLVEEQVFIKSVACGEAHTLLLDSEGKVYSFGWGDDGQLGFDNMDSTSLLFMKNMNIVKPLPFKVMKISAGSVFSACVDEIGQVYVWGNGELGQLGQGQGIKCSSTPVIVSLLNEEFIIDIVCGESYVLAMSQNGKVFAWGQGVAGFFKDQNLYPIGSDIICFAPRIVDYVKNTQEYLLKCSNKDSFTDSIGEKFKQFIGIGKERN